MKEMFRVLRRDGSFQRDARSDIFAILGALVVLASAAVVAYNALDPAGARISASTSADASLFEAGVIDLETYDSRGLLFDVDGLYPGLVLEHCVPVTYRGSLDSVDIRLTAQNRRETAGLAAYVDTEITVGPGTASDCSDHQTKATIFSGRLDTIWRAHETYDDGLNFASNVGDGFETTLRVTATVVDDDRAQGLDSDFMVILEARP